jgi:hypothetical protein
MDPVKLYRFLLHDGDRQVADALTQALRGDPVETVRADSELRSLPRGPARHSKAGIRVLTTLLRRTGAIGSPDLRSNGDAGER